MTSKDSWKLLRTFEDSWRLQLTLLLMTPGSHLITCGPWLLNHSWWLLNYSWGLLSHSWAFFTIPENFWAPSINFWFTFQKSSGVFRSGSGSVGQCKVLFYLSPWTNWTNYNIMVIYNCSDWGQQRSHSSLFTTLHCFLGHPAPFWPFMPLYQKLWSLDISFLIWTGSALSQPCYRRCNSFFFLFL